MSDDFQQWWKKVYREEARAINIDPRFCLRCKKFHEGPPFDEQKALDNAADEVARQIDQEILRKK